MDSWYYGFGRSNYANTNTEYTGYTGKVRVEAFSDVVFEPQKPIHRTIGALSGVPVNPPGTYTLQLYVRKQGDEEWNENPVSSYPLAIGVKEELPKVSPDQPEGELP